MASDKRIERLQKQILRIMSQKVLYELNDPRVSTFITLTKVRLNKDLSLAKIYFSVLGGESERKRAEHALKHASRHLRGELGQELVIRTLPDVEFIYDESIEGAVRIINRLNELTKSVEDEEIDDEDDEDADDDEEDEENDSDEEE